MLRQMMMAGMLVFGLLGSTAGGAEVAKPGGVVLIDLRQGGAHFDAAYESWQGKLRYEPGQAVLRGAGLTSRGGAPIGGKWDVSAHRGEPLFLVAKRGPGNRQKQLKVLLEDADGTTGVWAFDLAQLKTDQFTALRPSGGATLGKPAAIGVPGKTPGLDLAQITAGHLQGDYSPGDQPFDVMIQQIVAGDRLSAAASRPRASAPEPIKPAARTQQSPTIQHVAPVAGDILAIEIQAGRVIPGTFMPYEPQPEDQKKPADKGRQLILVRQGKDVGWLIGEKRDTLVTAERLEGDALQEALADRVATYRLRSSDDPNYAQPTQPLRVHRKSKPNDWAQPDRGFAMRHTIYLVLPKPLAAGKTYTIELGDLNVKTASHPYVHTPRSLRSEAVHVSQIGFRPDDPVKRGFLSVWLGTGGAYRYSKDLAFSLIDEGTNQSVYSGKVELAKDASEKEKMAREDNFNKTSVYRMDFRGFARPGKYRLYVEGIGCSYPFEIAPDVWQKAFLVQMKGFHHNRSGIELGPPYTTFRRPRDFHPADGARIYQSRFSAPDGDDPGQQLEKQSTGQLVPHAWGGYQDAGDWNPRHTHHLWATYLQLELAQMHPDYFLKLDLNIPRIFEVPDLLEECLWNLDLYRRLQSADGGVPRGIETNGDPIHAEVSWKQSMPAYVYAPDMQSSYQYVATAARAAGVLEKLGRKDLAGQYRHSVLKAMDWAEQELVSWKKEGKQVGRNIRMDRCTAALETYALTRDRRWHDVFLEDNGLSDEAIGWYGIAEHDHRDVAFTYARLDDALADPALKARAIQITEQRAQAALKYASGNAFNLTSDDPYRIMFLGFYSVPQAVQLVRAHHLTGKPQYLAGIVQATLFASGGNPNNMTYTTGLGSNPPLHTLKLDSRYTGQPTPAGMTPYGNIDFVQWKEEWAIWPIKYHLSKVCTPSAWDWPITEAYFDVFLFPAICEPTMNQTYGPNAYVWGYLAARK